MPPESLSDLIESIRTRVQAELDAQLPALAARHEEAIAATRREAAAEADRRVEEAVAAARRDAEADTTQRIEAETARRIAELAPPAPIPVSRTVVDAFGAIAGATALSDVLRATAAAASQHDASLYVGARFDRWTAAGRAAGEGPKELLESAMAAGRVVRRDRNMALPLVLDGVAVAVLQADSPSEADADALEMIARYAAAQLSARTALRVAQAQRWMKPPASAIDTPAATSPRTAEAEHGAEEDEEVRSARRYARLLVSEIKLYNEASVHEGRTQRDLSRRLAAEIDRARHLYEERVPATVADRDRHFQSELVQTLAGGDASLLG